MTVGSAESVANPQAAGKRITVTLIPTAEEDLRRLQERTNLSQTDLTNRAFILYEFFDTQLAEHDLISRDKRTGEARLVRLIDAGEEQAAPADPAPAPAPAPAECPAAVQRRSRQ